MTDLDMSVLAFSSSLSVVRPVVGSREQLLRQLAGAALRAGYVRESFEEALVAREERFPTGLPTPTPSAIPHTDAEHVLRPALVAALLGEPLEFAEMGGSGRTVDVELVVLLLVDDPTVQVTLLGRLVTLLQAPDLRLRLNDVTTSEELVRVLQP